ncbi:hypothetical protein [Pseudidiomarina sp. CB1]|uniref:hypothetical protein n=1 Tax=Pseudidiomarina sp. CB1 TaxID=2972484 RepID=UPI002162B39A|nr:hypothetical protein [Pseudidiomarina sp. CB1]
MKKEFSGYILSFISILVGVIVSWHFYDKSQQYRNPIYAVDDYPRTVLDFNDGDRDLPLKVISNTGEPIHEDIYIATHYFWNAGQKPILDTDILEPFRIRFNPKEVTILDVSISKSSRPVVSCEITQIDSSTFQVAYRIMENNDGCAIDYLYIGKRIPSVEVTGEIIGVRKINLSLKTWQDYYGEISRIENYYRYIPAFVMVSLFSIVLFLYFQQLELQRATRQYRLTWIILLVAALALFLENEFDGFSVSAEFDYPNLQSWRLDSKG